MNTSAYHLRSRARLLTMVAAAGTLCAVLFSRATADNPAPAPANAPSTHPGADEATVYDFLGGIDHVPSRATLDAVLGANAGRRLIALATAERADVDPGVRLRAYRALAEYPGQATKAILLRVVLDLTSAEQGIDLLYLQASMDALAGMSTAGDETLATLTQVLEHPNKDTRAAAATALGRTNLRDATRALYSRLGVEPDPLVRLALSEAIRKLAPTGR
jgi:hypothetical protein